MTSNLLAAQTPVLSALQPANRAYTTLTLLALLSSSALFWAALDYRAWLAYGTGGFDPADFCFVCKIRLRQFLTRNYGRSSQPLLDLSNGTSKRFLDPLKLPLREGPRPRMRSRPLPQRQTQPPNPRYSSYLKSYFAQLVSLNPMLLAASTSILERHGSALFVHPDARGLPQGDTYTRKWGDGEIAHVHEEEGSLHVVLEVLDAALVIERGWAERMPCVGIIEKVPLGNVLVYAPRTLKEVDIVKRIILAGCRYFTGKEVVGD